MSRKLLKKVLPDLAQAAEKRLIERKYAIVCTEAPETTVLTRTEFVIPIALSSQALVEMV